MALKRGPVTNIVKDVNCGLVTYSDSNLARWRKYFSRLFNAHSFSAVWQTEIHTAEPILPDPSAFVVRKLFKVKKIQITM